MAFTGDLEHLPIVDIIQLVHTTRKSGIFSVKSEKGESKIVFSGGYIVGANHVNDTVRIGTVLVKNGAVTLDDLKQALRVTEDEAESHRPLVATLMKMGKLKAEDAVKALKKLVELTIVELMSWTRGTFTFDTEAPVFTPEPGDAAGEMEQDVALDAQMVLMDALRVFDERERDRMSGKEVPAFEALYADVLPGEQPRTQKTEPAPASAAITADLLGLADVDRLEKKIPRPVSEMEIFDPVEIHRQKIRELLAGRSPEEQETFVSFLKKSLDRKTVPGAAARQEGKAVVLFSSDKLIRHSVMTLCKEERIPVFATDDGADLERIIDQCISSLRTPLVVFDCPGSLNGFSVESISGLRNGIRVKYAAIPLIQLAAPPESAFALRAYQDGVRAVLPKPLKENRKESYVQDTIQFLSALTAYVRNFRDQSTATDRFVQELKKDMRALREIATPSDAALVLLASVAEMCDRAVTFIVRPNELAGERSVGVSADKSTGPLPADRLKISLAQPSVFRDVIDKGLSFHGESSDDALKSLFQEIGKPVSPAVVLLPLVSDRKVVAVVYGDFGKKESGAVHLDILEILAAQVGIVLEYALFRRQVTKAAQKA
ncbi:MAG: DUF4388 domain-containing protein [Nitrospiraceae bacterium]|nr:DUF4388 domain-containing protein [Nitrospiraceae bacterium]